MSAEILLALADQFTSEHPNANLCFFEVWLEMQQEEPDNQEQKEGDSDE
jgi:hypothetical protein